VRVVGLGIDLLEIDRLERALARRPGLAERLFTAGEREYAASRAHPGRHLAARFCAKEAVAKSLGLEGWSFTDVEVIPGRPPAVRLLGRAERRARELRVSSVRLSLTHAREAAAAVAVAEGAEGRSEPPGAGGGPSSSFSL
jgi:holo-[acyl-carrier protein] synthase